MSRLETDLQRLVEAGKRDWTVEALLCDPKWHPLLTRAAIERARKRVAQIEQTTKTDALTGRR